MVSTKRQSEKKNLTRGPFHWFEKLYTTDFWNFMR